MYCNTIKLYCGWNGCRRPNCIAIQNCIVTRGAGRWARRVLGALGAGRAGAGRRRRRQQRSQGVQQARGHGTGGAGARLGARLEAAIRQQELRHGRGHAHDTAAAAWDTARPRGQGRACAHRLGQGGALSTWLSSDPVFGPGSTRYFPESLNEHCSL